MNERIQELIRSADVHILPDDSEYGHCIIGLEKFAELIVRECIVDFYRRYLDLNSNEDITVQVNRYVRDHFGVE
jgi:hypothetical protein